MLEASMLASPPLIFTVAMSSAEAVDPKMFAESIMFKVAPLPM